MLALTLRVKEKANEVIIRDVDGKFVCEVGISKIEGGRAVVTFLAPRTVNVNRRMVDETIDWTVGKRVCAICKGPLTVGERKDSSGMAHAVCSEAEMR